MSVAFWVWVATAAVLLIAEIAQPTGLYWPWTAGASAAAGCEAMGLGAWWQWGAFVVLASAIIVIAVRVRSAKTRAEDADQRTG